MLSELLGNERLRDSLCAALAAGRLSHGVLLCGEAGCGVGYAARCLAADYLYPQGGDGARLVMEGNCPEVLTVAGEGASGDIKIERIRAVRKELYNTALSSEGRVVLIHGAHKLNASGANALLKVLEEPPDGVLFLLIAPGEASVLPTIRSRCAVYSLAPVSEEICAAYLRKHYPRENAEELAALFGGKIGTAVRCVSDAGAKRRLADAKLLADSVQNRDAYAALVLLSGYEKERADAKLLLSYTAQLCSAALRGAYPYLDAQRAAHALPCLFDADAKLSGNVNAKLVLSVLSGRLARDAE